MVNFITISAAKVINYSLSWHSFNGVILTAKLAVLTIDLKRVS
jgi:hypothetical protein